VGLSTAALAMSILPREIAARMRDRDRFEREIERYRVKSDEDLIRSAETCLRNLGRLDDEDGAPGADRSDFVLRALVAPELCERISPGCRDRLRQIRCNLAEYDPDPDVPSALRRMLSLDILARLRERSVGLRRDVAAASALELPDLVDMARLAIRGSRAAERNSPDDPVYEPAFAYLVVPSLVVRALARDGIG
jgi:hypothetical protein